ncbi:NAD-dependent epimerase/dehydratase family protein [Streptomyces sp. NPDC001980]|uniref:NAD-dependent epimerase/dehydratase family protein n=1 Tax=Streptomyces sp. NPDC001980 TaxID=3157126 RepID=UPI00332DD69E
MRVPRMVVASYSSVYGTRPGGPSVESDPVPPLVPDAVIRLAEEQLCLAHASRGAGPTRVVGLRYFTVYDPRQRANVCSRRDCPRRPVRLRRRNRYQHLPPGGDHNNPAPHRQGHRPPARHRPARHRLRGDCKRDCEATQGLRKFTLTTKVSDCTHDPTEYQRLALLFNKMARICN